MKALPWDNAETFGKLLSRLIQRVWHFPWKVYWAQDISSLTLIKSHARGNSKEKDITQRWGPNQRTPLLLQAVKYFLFIAFGVFKNVDANASEMYMRVAFLMTSRFSRCLERYGGCTKSCVSSCTKHIDVPDYYASDRLHIWEFTSTYYPTHDNVDFFFERSLAKI